MSLAAGGLPSILASRLKEDNDIIFTVITRLEISKLKTELEKIAPNAFVVMHAVKDTKGGMIKKRPLKH